MDSFISMPKNAHLVWISQLWDRYESQSEDPERRSAEHLAHRSNMDSSSGSSPFSSSLDTYSNSLRADQFKTDVNLDHVQSTSAPPRSTISTAPSSYRMSRQSATYTTGSPLAARSDSPTSSQGSFSYEQQRQELLPTESSAPTSSCPSSSSSSESRYRSRSQPLARQRPLLCGPFVLQRRADSESKALSSPRSSPRPVPPHGDQRPASVGTMVLYRFEAQTSAEDGDLVPPSRSFADSAKSQRIATHSQSGRVSSVLSMSLDSRYPTSSADDIERGSGFVAYAYDPNDDDDDYAVGEEKSGIQLSAIDMLHHSSFTPQHTVSWREFLNVFALVVVVGGLLALFLGYPIADAMS